MSAIGTKRTSGISPMCFQWSRKSVAPIEGALSRLRQDFPHIESCRSNAIE
jgi:hypothetical protein